MRLCGFEIVALATPFTLSGKIEPRSTWSLRRCAANRRVVPLGTAPGVVFGVSPNCVVSESWRIRTGWKWSILSCVSNCVAPPGSVSNAGSKLLSLTPGSNGIGALNPPIPQVMFLHACTRSCPLRTTMLPGISSGEGNWISMLGSIPLEGVEGNVVNNPVSASTRSVLTW